MAGEDNVSLIVIAAVVIAVAWRLRGDEIRAVWRVTAGRIRRWWYGPPNVHRTGAPLGHRCPACDKDPEAHANGSGIDVRGLL